MLLVYFVVVLKGVVWIDLDLIVFMVMQVMLGGWDKNVGVGKYMGYYINLFWFVLFVN